MVSTSRMSASIRITAKSKAIGFCFVICCMCRPGQPVPRTQEEWLPASQMPFLFRIGMLPPTGTSFGISGARSKRHRHRYDLRPQTRRFTSNMAQQPITVVLGGSQGDIQPFLYLADELVRAGQPVRISSPVMYQA